MPINLETPGGYFDGIGQFHQNTALFPSPIPGLSLTAPINPSLPYNRLPDYQPYIPKIDINFPELPNIPGFVPPNFAAAGLGSFLGGAAASTVGPAIMLYLGYRVAKKQGWI